MSRYTDSNTAPFRKRLKRRSVVYFRTGRIFSIAAAAAVFGVMAAPARAQQATFHLPFEARLGRVSLDPGEYKLSAPMGVSGAHMIQCIAPDGLDSALGVS